MDPPHRPLQYDPTIDAMPRSIHDSMVVGPIVLFLFVAFVLGRCVGFVRDNLFGVGDDGGGEGGARGGGKARGARTFGGGYVPPMSYHGRNG